jgi:hypothetical protein
VNRSIKPLLLIVLAFLVGTAAALAQVDPVTIIDPMPNITAILGSAQMDGDPAEEIALVYSDERLIIVDSSSGLVEFDSDPYGWSYVYPPGYNLSYNPDQLAGHNFGFDVFVDEDGDGIFCLMSLISQGVIYERQLAVICLTDMPTSAPEEVPRQRSELDQNYPNPFNPVTTIDFHLASAGKTVMKIFDVRGSLVRTLLNEPVSAGSHSVIWDGTDNSGRKVASGSYFYQLEANGRMMTKKSLLVK